MKDIRIEEVYDAVTESRGEPPDPLIWEVAVQDRWVAEHINGETSLRELMDSLDRLSELTETVKRVEKEQRSSSTREPAENFRRWAINQIFAIEAAHIDAVEAFRSEWLAKGLLDMEEVEAWVMDRKSIEGPSSTWITTLADEDGNPKLGDRDHVGYTESSRIVKFVVPDRRWIRSEMVNAAGALIELASVADILHRRYDWAEAWAASFVLTGTVPPALVANWVITEPSPWPKARRRLTITVRPDIKPTQLIEVYREKRADLLRGDPMPRAIGEHNARLAVFAARHSTGYTWGETMHRWNQEQSDHQFMSEPRFTRDSRHAYNRVMGEPLNWTGKLDIGEDQNGTD